MCYNRYALRNTLVAKDLEQASRIAYGTRDRRFARVVTVAGQLIAGACSREFLTTDLPAGCFGSQHKAYVSPGLVPYDAAACEAPIVALCSTTDLCLLLLRRVLQSLAPCLVAAAGPGEA